jgi:hypothetical protein
LDRAGGGLEPQPSGEGIRSSVGRARGNLAGDSKVQGVQVSVQGGKIFREPHELAVGQGRGVHRKHGAHARQRIARSGPDPRHVNKYTTAL